MIGIVVVIESFPQPCRPSYTRIASLFGFLESFFYLYIVLDCQLNHSQYNSQCDYQKDYDMIRMNIIVTTLIICRRVHTGAGTGFLEQAGTGHLSVNS